MTESDLGDFLTRFSNLADAATQYAQRNRHRGAPLLIDKLRKHLGTEPSGIAVHTESVSHFRLADADVAIQVLIETNGGGELVGVGGGDQRWHTSFTEMLNPSLYTIDFPLGPVDYRTIPVGANTERSVVSFGVHLLHFEHRGISHPAAILVRGTNPGLSEEARFEVLIDDESAVNALMSRLRELMNEHSVLRGQVVSFVVSEFGSAFGDPSQGGVNFHTRPQIGSEEVILPDGILERISRHVIGIGHHREQLLAAGQHLKRGILLYGPPGTGKTHTIRYLMGQDPNATVILLSGSSLQLVGLAAKTARALAPAIVVLEDCDLVAEERGDFGASPLLFEVLDALDGLDPDSDVCFMLTTNRAGVLEPALAQRPGRVDLAVEIPKPDRHARRALLDLYAAGLPLSRDVLDQVADRTGDATASFTKELVRRAVLLATLEGRDVTDADLMQAVDEMLADDSLISQALFGNADLDEIGGYA